MMDIICASICYRGYADDEVLATCENAPKIGYRHMEIHGPMSGSVDAMESLDAEKVEDLVAKSGMRCAGIHPPSWGGADDEEAEQKAGAIARAVKIVDRLGGDHVTTTGASRRGEKGGLERVILCIRETLTLTREHSNIRLNLEPHYRNILEQAEDFEAVLAAVPDPRVGVCIDTGHFHSAHVDTISFIRRQARRIYNVHLKDHIGSVSVGIGRGEIDLASIVGALRSVNYAGDLTVELEVEDPQNLPRYTEEAYFYISGLLNRKL